MNAPPDPRLRLADLLTPGGWFHIARVGLGPEPKARHRHDFPELFWVTRGVVCHETRHGRDDLPVGALRFVRADDAHALYAASGSAVVVNVAFPQDVLDDYRQRYASDGIGDPWSTHHDKPQAMTLDDAGLERMDLRARRLEDAFQQPHRRLTLDRFLVNTLDELVAGPSALTDALAGVPAWLRDAAVRFASDPELLERGRDALLELTGRSGDHLNRVLKQALGVTTTQWVNRLRLDAAARRLRATDDPILAIAMDVGLPNLGHFYAGFKGRFGMTPRAYRLHHASAVLGTD